MAPTFLRPALRWVLPYAMTATSHRPASIAAWACATWVMNEEPPCIVLSWYLGLTPRYSHSATVGMRLCAAAREHTVHIGEREAAILQRAR